MTFMEDKNMMHTLRLLNVYGRDSNRIFCLESVPGVVNTSNTKRWKRMSFKAN